MKKKKILLIVLLGVLLLFFVLLIISFILHSQPYYRLKPEIWSQNSPYGENTEFKVNWKRTFLEPLKWKGLTNPWLYNLDEVRVIMPNGETYYLNKDFHADDYTGAVTQRWVAFGSGGLPVPGEYVFEFIKNKEVVLTKSVIYEQKKIQWPTNVALERRGNDMYVEWAPPKDVDESMWYKVIVKPTGETQGEKLDPEFAWNSYNAVLEDIPLVEGGTYTLKVALFFNDGYSFSELEDFSW